MKTLQYLFMTLAVLLLASPAFAQDAAGAGAPNQWVPLAAGLGMALAAGLCGLGSGPGQRRLLPRRSRAILALVRESLSF